MEVRARVPGVLQTMHFKPGTHVTEGDLLFVINPEEYEADLKAAQAELARREGTAGKQLQNTDAREDPEGERTCFGSQGR